MSDSAGTWQELREPVGRYLRSLGVSAEQAEEFTQETFYRACEKGGTVQRGWVFRVAHNLARDHQRMKTRRPVEPLAVVADRRPSPERVLLEAERTSRLRAAMARLPETQRHCLQLRAEGLKYREIAEVLEAPVSTVAEWVQTALRTLMEECDDASSR